jgi:hypothetical protein
MHRHKKSGESLGGAYLRCPDLLVMDKPGVPAMVSLTTQLVDTDSLSPAFTPRWTWESERTDHGRTCRAPARNQDGPLLGRVDPGGQLGGSGDGRYAIALPPPGTCSWRRQPVAVLEGLDRR